MNVDVLPAGANKVIHYWLGDEPQETTHRVMTPVEIMKSAKPVPVDPDTHYLVQLEGDHKISYQDKPDERIEMHDHAKFVAVSIGPIKLIHYLLDDEPQETTHRVMTPVEIMKSAKPVPVDPDTHYLVQLEGDHKISYQDKPEERIEMHDHAKFITVSIGPTPVS